MGAWDPSPSPSASSPRTSTGSRPRTWARGTTSWLRAASRYGAHIYSLLRTIFASAAAERPNPLIAYNPPHIRGAGNTKRAHHVQPASLEELKIIVEELPDRTS